MPLRWRAAVGLLAFVTLAPSYAAGEEGEDWLDGLDDDDDGNKPAAGAKDVDYDKMRGNLAELKALMESGDQINDPEVKKKLAAMQKQFGEMGMDTDEMALPDTDTYTACMAMGTRTAGFQTASTAAALRKMSEGLMPPAEAAENLVWRLVGTCVLDLTKEHAADFAGGRIASLPQVYVDSAQRPEAVERIRSLPEQKWKDFQMMSTALVQEMERKGVQVLEPVSGGSASNMGLLMLFPLLGVFGVLGKKFLDTTKEADSKKDKKSKKKSSKSK